MVDNYTTMLKKATQKECERYRGITLLNVVAKVYEILMEARLKEKNTHILQSWKREQVYFLRKKVHKQ